jgi:Tfp pilus assembly protein PilV
MRHILGSSLIESLVALAVFAMGSGSAATWMMQSMAVDARATRLVAATTIVVSLEARMRANRDGVVAGDYADAALPFRRDCYNGCDRRERAAEDLRAFRVALYQRLGPAAAGSVMCGPSADCAIVVTWSRREVLSWPFRP